MCHGLISYGEDEAGSTWSSFERKPWELVNYNDNY